MSDVYDVAERILSVCGEVSAMKLQKLVYYCQVWSIVWDEVPLFPNRIEAWANGPVCPDLYGRHRGMYNISPGSFSKWRSNSSFSKDAIETIETVIEAYGNKSAQWLSDQTHQEEPWLMGRKDLDENQRGTSAISHKSMSSYYGSL